MNSIVNYISHIQYMYFLFTTLSSGNIPLEITTDPEDMATSQETFVVTFTCEATGDPPISYQWFHNDVEIPSTNTTTYRIIFVGYNNFGSYHCSATSGSDEVVSNSATLTGMPFTCLCK